MKAITSASRMETGYQERPATCAIYSETSEYRPVVFDEARME